MISAEQFRIRVLAYLRRHNIPPSRFGRRVLGDAAFVQRLVEGREPTDAVRERVLEAMRNGEGQQC